MFVIIKSRPKPDRKFSTDMIYSMLAANSCLLMDVVDPLHESSKKVNVVDRFSKHLLKGASKHALPSYLKAVRKGVLSETVNRIDDSDIIDAMIQI